jgi:hypothetical protein
VRCRQPRAAHKAPAASLLGGRCRNGFLRRGWGLRLELFFAAQLGTKNRPQRELLGRAHPGKFGGAYLRHDQSVILVFQHQASLRLDRPHRGLAASQLKPIPSACLTPAFRAGSRPVERGKDMLARLTRKRRSTLPPGYAIKHLVLAPPAARAAP